MPTLAPTAASARMHACIPCQLKGVRPAAREARDFLAAQGCTEEEVMACELALVEACNNAVVYASKTAATKPVDVEVTCDENAIELRVTDHTVGFTLPDAIELPSAESETGRGLFIIKSTMNHLDYRHGVDSNTLVMTRTRIIHKDDAKRLASGTIEDFKRKLAESEQIINDMAEELSSCYETLSTIFRCGAELGKTNNFREFSASLCNDLLQITDADWYVLRLIPTEDSRLVAYSTSDSNVELAPLTVPSTSAAESAEVEAAASRSDVWFGAAQPLHRSDPLTKLNARAQGLVHPLFFADNLLGTLAVGKNSEKSRITAAQSNIIHTFADFLAIQIVNSRLQEEQLKSRLISRELEIARTIQQALLPRILPQSPGFRIAGYCESARQVGGDFYDVVEVGNNALLFIIADVMGKGVPAAMFAAILRSLLRAVPELNQQPAALLQRVNRLLFEELSEVEMFITAQLVYLDLGTRKLVSASAGHCPLLLGSPCLTNIKAIAPDGIPLGILPDASFSEQVEELLPGSRLLLYTDGLTDAQNGNGQFFGEQRLLDWFCKNLSETRGADQLKASLAGELKSFQGHNPPYDDQTFLVLAEEQA